MKNMSAISFNNLLLSCSHESYSILEKAMYKDLDKNRPAILSCPRYLARAIYKIRLNSWREKNSQQVTCICTNPVSDYHILLERPITTALFQKDEYDFTSSNNVIDFLYSTDVNSFIAKFIVHSPVGKLFEL